MVEFSYFLIDREHFDKTRAEKWFLRKLKEAEKNPEQAEDDPCYIILSKITERAIGTIFCLILTEFPHYLNESVAEKKFAGHWVSALITFSKISYLFVKDHEEFDRRIPEIKHALCKIIRKYELVCIPKIISIILKECRNSS